jgi:hypothetical protein
MPRKKQPKKKEAPPAPYHFWVDATEPNKQLTFPQFKKHLKDKYGITKEMKGIRRLNMHVDGDTWFSYVWDWEIDGHRFTQHTRNLRSKEDAAMWGGGDF